MEDQDVLDWIRKLEDEEHELLKKEEQGDASEAKRARRRELEELFGPVLGLASPTTGETKGRAQSRIYKRARERDDRTLRAVGDSRGGMRMYCLLTHRAGVELPHVRSKSYAPPLGLAMAVGDYVERIVTAALHLLASVRRTDGLHIIGSS